MVLSLNLIKKISFVLYFEYLINNTELLMKKDKIFNKTQVFNY